MRHPTHSDKDHNDHIGVLKLDKYRENGMKCRKKHSVQVGSTSILRPCEDVTASNASWLSFVMLEQAHTMSFAFLLHSFYDLSHGTLRLPCFNCAHLINSSPHTLHSHSFRKFSCVNNGHTIMPPKGCWWRRQTGQKKGSTSQPSPRVDAGAVFYSFSILSSSTTQEQPAH